jgi:hypothetical protein
VQIHAEYLGILKDTALIAMTKLFGILFTLTGIFALAGGLYTWGDGSIFEQTELLTVLIPWADILLTGPISIISGIGLLNKKYWGRTLGIFTSGIYMFGTALVYISMVWNNEYTVMLLIPSTSGLLISSSYLILVLTNKIPTNPRKTNH